MNGLQSGPEPLGKSLTHHLESRGIRAFEFIGELSTTFEWYTKTAGGVVLFA